MSKRKLQQRKGLAQHRNSQRSEGDGKCKRTKFKKTTRKTNECDGFSKSKKKSFKGGKRQQKRSKDEDVYNFIEVTQNPEKPDDGFPDLDSESDTDLQEDTRKMVQEQNRKKKKSSGFQSMGLSHPVFNGIIKKGYKIPTPIQRRTIPLILDGKDVVAMARTGSGKTAAFLIPMFERLKCHQSSGVRAIILSPTRELALQTLKFTKELGRFMGLKCAVILGGDCMEEQFAALHENPDVIIATPGRFMHVLVEMELKLTSVEYVVFDEADRLFELGFQEQLHEIIQRLPESRQTLLFSATLPKLLVDFAKAGLNDPTLVRLDVDTKLSENLRMVFLHCRSDDKLPMLMYLLRNIIKSSEQTVIFSATKHHVEYLNMVLTQAGFSCSYCYSTLDQTARKINVAKFRNRKTLILLVTDLAARGIDIPLLDNVINYNFPAKSKLFVHRVGRVARAGSSGTAYSFVSPDELPYVLDLHLFLGRPLKAALPGKTYTDTDGLLGRVPQSVIDDEEQVIRHWKDNHDIKTMEKVIKNAYKNYIKSKPAPSPESIRRMKDFSNLKLAYHPIFASAIEELEKSKLLEDMRSFKPRGTIFEVNANKKSNAFKVMKKKRQIHENVIFRNLILTEGKIHLEMPGMDGISGGVSAEDDINETFSHTEASKLASETKSKVSIKDEDVYVNYRPKDFNTEMGLGVTSSFEKDAADVSLDIIGDDSDEIRRQHNQLKWDRKRKKYIAQTGMELKKKKVKTESGQWIPATYKTNLYKEWLGKSKVAERMEEEDDASNDNKAVMNKGQKGKKATAKIEIYGSKTKKARLHSNGKTPPALEKRFQGGHRELKTKEQIIKERNRKEKLRRFMKQQERKRKKLKHATK